MISRAIGRQPPVLVGLYSTSQADGLPVRTSQNGRRKAALYDLPASLAPIHAIGM